MLTNYTEGVKCLVIILDAVLVIEEVLGKEMAVSFSFSFFVHSPWTY
jgi:hypothetical protein